MSTESCWPGVEPRCVQNAMRMGMFSRLPRRIRSDQFALLMRHLVSYWGATGHLDRLFARAGLALAANGVADVEYVAIVSLSV